MQQRAATKNFAFIVSLTSNVNLSLHQRDSICAELLSFGDAAIALRQGDRLLEVGQALCSLPLPQSFRAVGDYYTGIATADRGRIEHAVSLAPARYRARAILALGWYAKNHGDEAWPQLYAEAVHQARSSQDVYTAVHASKMLAVSRGIDGDHQKAILQLESLWPMIRLIARQDPATYHDWLNSLAVELAEVGRTDEAARAIQIVSASPLIDVYPEWRETAAEIQQQQAQPVVIAVPELRAKRAAVVAVAVLACAARSRCSSLSMPAVRAAVLLSGVPLRVACRAGPRAPPAFIL